MSHDQLQFIDYSKPKKDDEKDRLVAGSQQRVRISAHQVFSHYPPPNVSGDYSSVVPHICFSDGQLPWERQLVRQKYGLKAGYPWLYLLLINENDIKAGDATRPTSRQLDSLDHNCYFSPSQLALLHSDQHNGVQSCVCIDVRKQLLDQLVLDRMANLAQLAHVRRRWQKATHGWSERKITRAALDSLGSAMLFDIKQTLGLDDTVRSFNVVTPGKSWLAIDTEHGESLIELDYQTKREAVLRRMSIKRELSVLMANRFCQRDTKQNTKNLRHYAIVVSLEQFFEDENDYKQLDSQQHIRLIGLHYWQFDCNNQLVGFNEQVKQLAIDSMHYNDLLKAPEVPAWYHGPLLPYQQREPTFIHHSWQLPSIENNHQILEPCEHDKGYQIAFELGRFLSLHNKGFRKALARYHRVIERSRQFKQSKQVKNKLLTIDPMTDQFSTIESWCLSLAQFKQIPTWYFIPDSSVVAVNKIKLFVIDSKWIQNLWWGALSIQGEPSANHKLFQSIYHSLFYQLPKYGAIVKGDVVNTYPELTTCLKDSHKAKTTREQTNDIASSIVEHPLSFDSRMFLTSKPFDTITLALPPECLHYGADYPNQHHNSYYRKTLINKSVPTRYFEFEFIEPSKAIFDPNRIMQLMAQALDEEKLLSEYKSAKFGRLMTTAEPRLELNLQANDY